MDQSSDVPTRQSKPNWVAHRFPMREAADPINLMTVMKSVLSFIEGRRIAPRSCVILLLIVFWLSGCSSQTEPAGSNNSEQSSMIGSRSYNSGTRGFEAPWPYGPETNH
jgi:hypothetical protein